ncbi:NusG domain II-containing protein [Pseudothermotoga sp.]
MNSRDKLFKKRDLFLIISLMAVFLGLYWGKSQKGQTVEVFVGGKLSMQIGVAGSYELHDGDKYLMKVVFDGQKIHVENADCPLKICEKTGRVGPGGVIICVPNRVLIKFRKVSNEGVDVMTW